MPIRSMSEACETRQVTASGLLNSLSYIERKFDGPVISSSPTESLL